MCFFPFEPREVLENHLSPQTQQLIKEKIRRVFEEDGSELSGIEQNVPVVNAAIDWVLAVYNAEPFEIASVPEWFNKVLKQPDGIHVLDYVLSSFQPFLGTLQPFRQEDDQLAEGGKARQLIDYFFPILQRYKMRISSEKLEAVSENCRVVEGALDFSENTEIEKQYQESLVQRDGAPEIRRFLEEHPNHPLQLYIKAFVAQSRYHLSSLVNPWLDALYEHCDQPNRTTIDKGVWHIRENDDCSVSLIFHADIVSEEKNFLANHSLEYSITLREGKVYGKLEQFTLTPHTDEVRRLCVAGALFGDHLFPLEHPDNLFMNNFEDRLVLDSYLDRFFSAIEDTVQKQFELIEVLNRDASASLHAVAVLAVLEELAQKNQYFGLEIQKKQGGRLQDLLKYREGVHFLDYVLGEFYKRVFKSPNKKQSKKTMHALVHHFLPIMLKRKIVYPHLGHIAQGNRILVEPLTSAFDELNEKYSDSGQRTKVAGSVESSYLVDKERGLTLLNAVLECSPENPLAFFLKALLSQGHYGVVNGTTGPSSQWFREKNIVQRKNLFCISLNKIADGHRISIQHACHNLADQSINLVDERSEFPSFHSTLTFELTWNEEQEKAELRFIGVGYTPYDGEIAAPMFARQQCFGETSKQPQMATANSPMPKAPETYHSYLKRFLFLANSEAISHRWVDYFQHYLHVSLAVRPVFLNVILQSDLPSRVKETIFEKIFKQQSKDFLLDPFTKFESLKTFCFQLHPDLKMRFYRQFRSYLDETREEISGGEISKRERWLTELGAKQLNDDSLLESEGDFELLEMPKKFAEGESVPEDAVSEQTVPAGEQLETLTLPENTNASGCEKLFSGIVPYAKCLHHITIQGKTCDPKIILSLLRYLPQVQEIEFKTQEGSKVVNLNQLREKMENVGGSKHCVAIRKTKALEQALNDLGLLQLQSLQSKVFPELYFFKRQEIDEWIGDAEEETSLFYVQDNTLLIPAIEADSNAFQMVLEQVSDFVEKHKGQSWTLDLDQVVEEDPFCLERYRQIHGVSLQVSITGLKCLINFCLGHDSKEIENDYLLSLLLSLTVSIDEREVFGKLIVQTLSEYTELSDSDKFEYLEVFSIKHPSVYLFKYLYETINQNSSADLLRPTLWKASVERAVAFLNKDSEQFQTAGAILFQLVLQDHPERVDALTNDEWFYYRLALKNNPEFNLSDLTMRRVQKLLAQENGLFEDDLNFLQKLFDDVSECSREYSILRNVLLLYGRELSEDPEILKDAVRFVFAIVEDQRWLQGLCYDRLDESLQRTLVAKSYLVLQLEKYREDMNVFNTRIRPYLASVEEELSRRELSADLNLIENLVSKTGFFSRNNWGRGFSIWSTAVEHGNTFTRF